MNPLPQGTTPDGAVCKPSSARRAPGVPSWGRPSLELARALGAGQRRGIETQAPVGSCSTQALSSGGRSPGTSMDPWAGC
jgi:hypothetical protein